jgi:hypothetical protein
LSETRWKLTGCAIECAYFDKGYPGHGAADPRRVFISGQKRGVFGLIKRELRRRSAIEPVIGHMKINGYLGRSISKAARATQQTSHSPPSATIFGAFAAEGPAAPDPDRSMAGIRRHPGSQQRDRSMVASG